MRFAAVLAGALLTASGSLAHDASAAGEWARVDGKAHVRIEPCADALCGYITWVKDAKAPGKVGQKVFYEMKADGDGTWSGKAFNPDDGNEYTGKMILQARRWSPKAACSGG